MVWTTAHLYVTDVLTHTHILVDFRIIWCSIVQIQFSTSGCLAYQPEAVFLFSKKNNNFFKRHFIYIFMLISTFVNVTHFCRSEVVSVIMHIPIWSLSLEVLKMQVGTGTSIWYWDKGGGEDLTLYRDAKWVQKTNVKVFTVLPITTYVILSYSMSYLFFILWLFS